MDNQAKVTRVTLDDIDVFSAMFNEYRQFYQQKSDFQSGKNFIKERLTNDESVAFIAWINNQAAGFVQLYPSYSSVYLKKVWILNDLYVRSFARRQGVGFALLDAGKELAKNSNSLFIKVATGQSNFTAQQVYESKGYVRDKSFYHYRLHLDQE